MPFTQTNVFYPSLLLYMLAFYMQAVEERSDMLAPLCSLNWYRPGTTFREI